MKGDVRSPRHTLGPEHLESEELLWLHRSRLRCDCRVDAEFARGSVPAVGSQDVRVVLPVDGEGRRHPLEKEWAVGVGRVGQMLGLRRVLPFHERERRADGSWRGHSRTRMEGWERVCDANAAEVAREVRPPRYSPGGRLVDRRSGPATRKKVQRRRQRPLQGPAGNLVGRFKEVSDRLRAGEADRSVKDDAEGKAFRHRSGSGRDGPGNVYWPSLFRDVEAEDPPEPNGLLRAEGSDPPEPGTETEEHVVGILVIVGNQLDLPDKESLFSGEERRLGNSQVSGLHRAEIVVDLDSAQPTSGLSVCTEIPYPEPAAGRLAAARRLLPVSPGAPQKLVRPVCESRAGNRHELPPRVEEGSPDQCVRKDVLVARLRSRGVDAR